MSIMQKTLQGHCNIVDKFSVGDSAITKMAITVGVGKHNGEKWMSFDFKIFNLNA